jgi:hypothetical protein
MAENPLSNPKMQRRDTEANAIQRVKARCAEWFQWMQRRSYDTPGQTTEGEGPHKWPSEILPVPPFLQARRQNELRAMVDYAAVWHRLAQEFYDFPDPYENLRADKTHGRWQLIAGMSEPHDHARIQNLYAALAKRAAAAAGTKTGSLEEWLDLIVAVAPPHETQRDEAVPPTRDGLVLQPDVPVVERLCIVSSDCCKRLKSIALAEAVRIAPKSEESERSGPATVANTEIQPKNDPRRGAPPASRPQDVQEPGSLGSPGPAGIIKAMAIPADHAHLAASSFQDGAKAKGADLPESTVAARQTPPLDAIATDEERRNKAKRDSVRALQSHIDHFDDPIDRVAPPGNDSAAVRQPEPGTRLDLASEAGRYRAVAASAKRWTCSEACLARTAVVDRADLSKWKKGSLPATSDKSARVEKPLGTTTGLLLPRNAQRISKLRSALQNRQRWRASSLTRQH